MYTGNDLPTHPYVLVDLNTQHDFFHTDGACPVLDIDELYKRLRRLIAWVRRNQVPLISSMDVHRDVETAESSSNNGRCIEGTEGQTKLDFTVLPNHVYIAGDNTLSVRIDLFKHHQQVIFPQRSEDLFANPKADRFITQLKTEEFIVFGAVAEHEVRAIVLGLLARNKKVAIVADGCGAWNLSESDLSIRQMQAKGARVTTVDELVSCKLCRRWRYAPDGVISAFRPIGYADPEKVLPADTNNVHRNGHRNGRRNGQRRSQR